MESIVDVSSWSDPLALRLLRWWSAYPGSSVSLPMVMVDSGHDYSYGYENFMTNYSAMVDTSLARPPLAQITANLSRVGDHVHVTTEVTNKSEVTLGSSNSATVWVIVYEVFEAPGAESLTSRYVRTTVRQAISTNLANNATATFTLDTPDLSGVVWNNLRAVVLVDYLPAGSTEQFDTLQAIDKDIP